MANVELDPADIMQRMIDSLTDDGLQEMIGDAVTSEFSQESWDKMSELILALDSGGTSNSYALKAREHLSQAAVQISRLVASLEVTEEEAGE
jgi:hypothetical protein